MSLGMFTILTPFRLFQRVHWRNDGEGLEQYIFQDVCVGGVSWTSWGTRFQVGMTGADQRRYLRSDE